jgi:FKBP-type peptidyl-prolyl cis-trans isomerase
MRRLAAAILVPAAACAVLAGCGSSGSSGSSNANSSVTVSGTFDKAPTITIPKAKASTNLAVTKPIKGSGPAVQSGNAMLANVALYKWSGTTHTLIDSTYSSTGPQTIPAQLGLKGLTTALKGARVGDRIVAVLPPKFGYGTSGNSQLQISGTDTVVWVIDVLQQYSPTASASGAHVSAGGGALPKVSAPPAGQAPVITVPKSAPPAKLTVTTLIKGTGPKLATGDTVVAQYVGSIWRTGKAFTSSWPSAQSPTGLPYGFKLGGGVIAGWNQGLVGVPVGSRVMLVIPPALGYGPAGGQPSAGITKNDSLVFVIDVVGSHPAGS